VFERLDAFSDYLGPFSQMSSYFFYYPFWYKSHGPGRCVWFEIKTRDRGRDKGRDRYDTTETETGVEMEPEIPVKYLDAT